jgi:beta-lactam-binding protein with PASTA domain
MSLTGFLLRLLAAAGCAGALAGAAITFAADRAPSAAPPSSTTQEQRTLVVPDVEGQVYVFAKGILEEAGFGWTVNGSVRGFAANTVAKQFPKPGTGVVDTGAPMVTLTLARNKKYREQGTPEDRSPYAPTVVLFPKQAPQRGSDR